MEKENSELQPNFLDLRKQAEEKLRQKNTELSTFSDEKKDKLINELQVHQIELEMQNEELRNTQLELSKTKDEYTDLYDNAPVGYFLLNENGIISKVNQTLANMLDVKRAKLLNIPFANFVDYDFQDNFYFFLNQSLQFEESQEVELKLKKGDGSEFYASLKSVVVEKSANDLVEFRIIVTDITERKQAEEKIKASLKEKETLLQEIHHRVKNNFTIVSSLLSLQASSINDERLTEALLDSKNRLQTMSAIHETLYQSENLSAIDMSIYLSKLGNDVARNYSTGSKLNLKVESENILIGAKQASPIGLVVNELVTNSLKYAFPTNEDGEIKIILQKAEDQIELEYSDNGIGMPEGFDWKNSKSLGLKLVRTLVENQLDGSIEMESKNGTKFIIKFNLET
jgi:PAS domain S-box-containing protein